MYLVSLNFFEALLRNSNTKNRCHLRRESRYTSKKYIIMYKKGPCKFGEGKNKKNYTRHTFNFMHKRVLLYEDAKTSKIPLTDWPKSASRKSSNYKNEQTALLSAKHKIEWTLFYLYCFYFFVPTGMKNLHRHTGNIMPGLF